MGGGGGAFALMRPGTWIPYLVTGTVSALATGFSPRIMGPMVQPMTAYGIQAGVAVLGGLALPMVGLGRMHGLIWFLVGMGVVMSDVVYRYIMPQLGLAAYPYEAHAALSSMGQEPFYPPRLSAYPGRYTSMSSIGDAGVGAYEPQPPMRAPWETAYAA